MLAIALLAAAARTVNLLGLDPFIDEASWTDWAVRELVPSNPRTWFAPLLRDGRPPLHFWLTLPFAALVDNGILASRLAAAFAGTLSALALYGLGREVAGRLAAFVAAACWAVSPFSVSFARIGADDAVLALATILATWASVRLARQPSARTGALCGLALGLAVLAKTTGVLLVPAPLLAILVVGHPFTWRRYIWPLVVAALAGLAVILPLLVWLPEVLAQLALHARPAGDGARRDLLGLNVEIASVAFLSYAGRPFVLLAGAGLALALVLRQRALLLVVGLGALWLWLLLDRSTSLFSRYLLFAVFPIYLLAGYGVAQAASGAVRLARGAGAAAVTIVAAAVVVLGLALGLGPRAELALDIVTDPLQAAIPESERYRYVEQWYAVYGLGEIARELRVRGQDRPVTVLVPPASREDRVLVPYGALRSYLRHDPRIRFVEAPALWRAQDLRELRRLARDGPTYLVVNGSHTDAPGTPNEIPSFTRRLEGRLAQDVPESREVARIPRPSAPNWLALYRLDRGP